MSISKKNSPKTFDQTICFTFFQPWLEAIRTVAETDPQKAIDAFLVLGDYCLYGIEPYADRNPWGIAWPVISAEAKRSINNRRRGFGAENTAQTESIKNYHAEHPEATQQNIADAVHCSIGKVNKVIRSLDAGTDIHTDNSNNNVLQCTLPKPCFLSADADEEVFGLPTSAAQKGGDAE